MLGQALGGLGLFEGVDQIGQGTVVDLAAALGRCAGPASPGSVSTRLALWRASGESASSENASTDLRIVGVEAGRQPFPLGFVAEVPR